MISQRRKQVKRENKVFALIVAAGMILLSAKLYFLWFWPGKYDNFIQVHDNPSANAIRY